VIKKFLILCSGSDAEILYEQCSPHEQRKHATIGATVLLTSIFAFISSSFALHSVFGNEPGQLFSIYGIAFLWASFIFSVDRIIVSSIKRILDKATVRKEYFFLLFRFALALLIAISISKPLEIKIVEKAIDFQLAELERTTRRHYTTDYEVNYNKAYDTVMTVSSEITNSLLPAYKLLSAELAACQGQLRELKRVQSHRAGLVENMNQSGIAEEEKTRLRADLEKLDRTYPKLDTMIAKQAREYGIRQGRVNEKQREIVDARQTETLSREKMTFEAGNIDKAVALLKTNEDRIRGGTGAFFVNQIREFGKLKKNDDTLWWMDTMLTLLFLMVETMPILSKVIMPPGQYDYIVKENDDVERMHLALKTDSNERIAAELNSAVKNWQVPDNPQETIQKINQRYRTLTDSVLEWIKLPRRK
jgi:hypothetical protein